ncbi:MAG: DNA-processing protein DprA [Anaerolineaceae bacterium]
MDTRCYYIGFNLVRGIGSVRLKSLVGFFGRIDIAWQAPADALAAAGLPSSVVENMLAVRQESQPDDLLEKALKDGIQVITWEDEQYPERLKTIDQSPPVIYVKGAISLEDEWAVGIVGTRRVTGYGRQVTEELATYLANNHITVISGLARGVDAAAHQAVLKAGGRTLAVLGCGVDVIYPPEHKKMADAVIENGALISDYPPGTAPESGNFPPRNRIISGLARALVVVEAGVESGALITARYAVEQGREVYAVPGSIYAPMSKGTNKLIFDGAAPLLKMDDVLQSLDIEKVQAYKQARLFLPADDMEKKILAELGDEPVHIDEIRAGADISAADAISKLTILELTGHVKNVGEMNYVLIRESNSEYQV